jgi:Carbohydrate esterase, sialic acid-specific acetylesterase
MQPPIMQSIVFTMILAALASALSSANAEDLQQRESGKKLKIFLFAGQSNMEGRANGNALTTGERERLDRAQKRVQLAFNRQPVGPLDVVKPSDEIKEIYQRDTIFGPELFFGLALAEAWPDQRMLLVKYTAGATSLYGAWNADWTEEKAAVTNEADSPKLYTDFIGDTRKLLAAYNPGDYQICAMFWVQGETDSNIREFGPEPAEQYGQNLRRFIEQLRTDLNSPELPFLLLQVGAGKVVKGMKQTAHTVPNVIFLPQSPDPQSDLYLQRMKNGHYNYEGMKRIGERFAETFLGEYASRHHSQNPQ